MRKILFLMFLLVACLTNYFRVTFNKWGVHLILLHGYIIYRSFFTQGVIGIF